MTTDNTKIYALPKAERLTGETTIGRLFAQGQSFVKYPLRVVYAIEAAEGEGSARMLISVPKKRFKRAVKRNRVKRLVREAFRLNKSLLAESIADANIKIAFIFLDKQLPTQEQVTRAVVGALTRIAARPAEASETTEA